jgi:hypothetical protein
MWQSRPVVNFEQLCPFGEGTFNPSPRRLWHTSVTKNATMRSRLPQKWSSAMSQQRRRFKHSQTFEEQLAEEARRFREAAEELPEGIRRELLLLRARQAETASHVSEWLRSPGLRPPE